MNQNASALKADEHPLRNLAAMCGGFVIVGILWCVLFPWIGRQPVVQKHIDRLEGSKVDPSAMYYTELDVMDGILDRLEGRATAPKIDSSSKKD